MDSLLASRGNPPAPIEDEDDWEYEYSTTETETFYLILDLSLDNFINRNPPNVQHGNRAGYRVWTNPVFRNRDAEEYDPPRPNDDDADEQIDLPTLRAPTAIQSKARQQRPPLSNGNGPNGEESEVKSAEDVIQVIGLHTAEPLVAYRNLMFRGNWAETIGTEMIFTTHKDETNSGNASLPVMRNLHQGYDLLDANRTRINFHEVLVQPRGGHNSDETPLRGPLGSYVDEDFPDETLEERYTRNGGVYIHLYGDKYGERRPQARFLEDLISLKRHRGETDDVTVYPADTSHNELFRDDLGEERRRKKAVRDKDRKRRLAGSVEATWEMAGKGYAVKRRKVAQGPRKPKKSGAMMVGQPLKHRATGCI